MISKINFNDPYKRSDFMQFLEWFLPDDFIVTEEKFGNLNFTTKYTEDVTKLGTCSSLELDVFEITHKSTHDARVGIAQDAFRLMLHKSYNNRALIIFKPENSQKYRFSLLQIEAEVSDNSSRTTRSYSNPRRYSFQLGVGAHVKTPEQFLLGGELVKKDGSYFNDLESRFSVEVLTKQFYKELSDWYFWALRHVEFPSKPTYEDSVKKDKPLEEMVKEHYATNVIRLLTRLLFVWFIKQKDLIPDELFDVYELENNILTELNPVKQDGLFSEMGKESVFYKAILQNLFFASLNCPIKPQSGDEDKRERGFRRNGNYGDDFGNDWLFRYEKHFKDPDAFVELINSKVPFLNGGLFECLDDKANKIYIDGFSDKLPKTESLIVPDYLFFGKDESVDLSEDYGDTSPQYKQTSVKGLINILKAYNFTVEENTPAEVVVALDPELLGKVFENLLASFNPETKTTARKQTGSFYTPREIVNYMVDESLIAYFKGKTDIKEDYIRILFEYTDEEHELSTSQIEELINALYECKILDPACGSGAFPMGVLQKLVHVLQKVDPENKHWKKVQNDNAAKEIQQALDIEDRIDRENRLLEINNAFDVTKNRPDYARKLYLIENCIYGVDLQPIAIQISKLRFFISLVVDQKNKYEDENFGIIPLPNLETKFVAANTLLGINRPSGQHTLSDTDEIRKLQEELRICRHKIFSAKTRKTKQKYRLIDREKRLAIAEELKNNGWSNCDSDKLANWDPYDQKASSTFFDPEWMFGLQPKKQQPGSTKGGYFNIIIANPPYVVMPSNNIHRNYKTYESLELYAYFFERGETLLFENGIISYITASLYLKGMKFDSLRNYLESNTTPIQLIVLGDNVFENVKMPTAVFIAKKCRDSKWKLSDFSDDDSFLYKLKDNNVTTIKDISQIMRGLEIGRNRTSNEGEIPFITGSNIQKFYIKSQSYISHRTLNAFGKDSYYFTGERILIRETGSELTSIYLDYELYSNRSLYSIKINNGSFDYKFVLACLNSKILQFYYEVKFKSDTNLFPKIRIGQVKELPIPKVNNSQQQPVIAVVNQIIKAKAADQQADTLELESQMNLLLYKLYNLNYNEVKVVDSEFGLTEEEYVSLLISE